MLSMGRHVLFFGAVVDFSAGMVNQVICECFLSTVLNTKHWIYPTENGPMVEVCPEEWTCDQEQFRTWCPHVGRKYVENCTGLRVKKLENILTFLLLVDGDNATNRMSQVVKDLRNSRYAAVRLLIVTKTALKTAVETEAENHTNAAVVAHEWQTLGKALIHGLKKVDTKYTILLRDSEYFDDRLRIERLIRLLSYTDTSFVGGSHRQSNGYWNIGCYQSRLKNYTFHVYEGYDLSYNSCIFCHYLSGPFAAKTSLLKDLISDDLEGETVYADVWIKSRGRRAMMVCPDVMFETSRITVDTDNRNAWKDLAKKYQFSIIKFPSKRLTFSCEETGTSCSPRKGLVMPVCCYEQLTRALVATAEQLDDQNIHYELCCGTALGGVKFSMTLPWEIDHDIGVLSVNLSDTSAIKTVKKNLESMGYSVTGAIRKLDKQCIAKAKFPHIKHCGEHEVNVGVFHIALWGTTRLTRDLWKPHKAPTRIRMDGYWMRAKPNPALYVRSYYGDDYFKHVEHFRIIEISGNAPYQPKLGRFLNCPKPGFHGCLKGNYLPFGSTQFGET